jgi:starch synthase
MEIFHISAECYPVVKVGGLADVVGALPKHQSIEGHAVRVVIPCYETKFIHENEFECVHWGHLKLGHFNFPFSVLKEKTNQLGFELYVIEIKELFDRNEVYSYEDDIERFLSFQIATLDWIIGRREIPDVINCHDHHAGLIPFMMQYAPKYAKLKATASVITIHSGLYQGIFGFDKLYYLPEFDLANIMILEWGNAINSLAAGIKCAQKVTTVSPNYLNELGYSSNGLESLFNLVRYKSKGILNGIDIKVWDPEKDVLLVNNYSIKNVEIGKQKNKEKLCNLFNLDPTKPLFSFIGRLLYEKGADLLSKAIELAFAENNDAINILILGSGNAAIENELNTLLIDYKGNYNTFIGYNEELSHLIYAGSDFLLMPSRVEPCGLNQMYAFRYGTIPIVRRTGGLKDTVIDIEDNGNGICYDEPTIEAICFSIQRALMLYNDKKRKNALIKSIMEIDHSWTSVCKEYIEVYQLII